MSEHTPGPWTWQSPEGTVVRDPQDGTICQLKFLKGPHGLGGRRDTNEVEANARLIAAAPILLQVLREIEAIMSIVEPRSDKKEYTAGLDRVRLAIAKAVNSPPTSADRGK